MAENNVFSYTRRDYEGSRQEGIAKIPILSRGNWTDLNATDPGIIILDYVHALVDMMSYYLDHQALESFITTAKERSNLFRLAKQLSYDIRSAKGALCDVTFTSYLTYDHPIKIPKYTVVSTENEISYLTTEDSYLPTRANNVTVTCMQGTVVERRYTGTGVSRFSNITGAKNQEVLLTSTSIDIDTISITDNLERAWNRVEYLAFSSENERVYQIELNPDDTVSIKFGDGQRGAVPNTTDIFSIKYVVTKAEEGRVEAGSLILLEEFIQDNESYVEFTVSNNLASTGGVSAQSSTEIRELSPGIIKAQDRAVTLSDFESLTKIVPGVLDAKAYDINIDSDIPYYEVKVLIIADEENENSLGVLRNNVYKYLSQKVIPPTNIQVITPTSIPVDISVTVKTSSTEIESGLEYTIRQAITDYFKERAGAIGEDFYPADLSAVITRIQGVRYIVSITPTELVQISNYSVAKLGQVTVTLQ